MNAFFYGIGLGVMTFGALFAFCTLFFGTFLLFDLICRISEKVEERGGDLRRQELKFKVMQDIDREKAAK